MSSLGELYFQLGLDDKKFNDAIEAAKQKVKELGADVEVGIKTDLDALRKEIQAAAKAAGGGAIEIDAKVKTSGLENLYSMLEDSKRQAKELEEAIEKASAASVKVQKQSELDSVRKRIADQEAKIIAKGGSLDAPKSTIVKVELDEEAINQVKTRLAQLETPITPKVSIEYDREKFNAVSTTLENYTKRLNELGKVKLGIDDSFIRNGVSQNGKGVKGWLSNVSDYLLGDDSGAAGKSIKSIQKILDNYTFKVKTEVDAKRLVASISNAVKVVPIEANIDIEAVKKKLKQLGVPLNFNMTQAIADAKANLKKHEFKAKLNLVIDKAKVSKAIKEAFAKKGLEYQASPSDVRNARILEIQQRMEHRQQKFTGQVDNSNKSMNRMLRTTKHVSDWAGQLSNQFANFISVYSIERFVRSLYTIGGEFQKQQIALRTMIGDAEKGDVVFERMKDLAVKSPFTFSDLASYTKQMAAYGIEYEELYDTTKRLADISAGVGVDMGRLILAYGQVRSAEVLRGQELRQFTEAGIPLVAELAKRLSEVRGEAVKVGEVFDAISKRQVSFDMVKDVLFDMTDPGGRFFEMQEELAKSLAGQWSNLKDAWDIMIADIANSSNNVLSKAAGFFSDILRSWRELIPILTAIAGAIGVVTSAIRVATTATTILNAVSNANPWMKLASVILGAAGAIGGWVLGSETAAKNATQLNAELDEEIQKWNENRANALRYIDTLKSANTSEERRILLYKELIELYPSLFENMKLETFMLKDIANLKTSVNEETTKEQLARIEKEIEDERLIVKYIRDSQKRKTAQGAMVVRSLSDEEKAKLNKAESRIAELEERKAKLQQDIDREGLISKLTPESDLSKYVEVYRELGKAVKILRQGGVKGEISNPKEFTTTLEYYDQLNTLLKEQNEIKEKFKPTTDEYKAAASLSKIYESAIKAIGGVPYSKKKTGKTEAEKAAERDAKAYLEALKNEAARIGEKWSLFKELVDATGNRHLAMKIAFDGQAVSFESELEWLKHRIQEEAKKANVNMSVADLLGLGEKQLLDKGVEEKFAKSLGHLIDTYNKSNKKLSVDTIKEYAEIIKASRNFEEQIAAIDAKLQEDLANLRTIYKDDPTALNFAEAEAKRRADEQKSNLRFEQFKKETNWIQIFDDLDRVSGDAIYGMIEKIEEFSKSTNLSQDKVKQLMEALGKLREKTFDFNPFGSLADAMKRLRELQSMQKKVNPYGVTLYDRGSGYGENRYMSEAEYQNALQGAESDIIKSIGGISDKFNDLKNVLDPLVDMFGGADTVFGKIIGGLSNAFNSAVGMGNSVNSLANLKFGGKDLGTILGLGGNAGFWGAVAGAGISITTALLDAFGADYSSYNKMKEEYDNLLGVWDALIERKKEYVDIDYADEARKVGQEALGIIEKQIDAYRTLGKERLNAGSGIGSHSIGMRIKKYMSEEGWGQYQAAMKEMGLDADWVAKDRMELLFEMSAEQLAQLQEKAPVFWAKLDEDVREYLENIIASNEALEEMRDTLNETMTGVSLDAFYDNYISMLTDLDKSNQDFAQSFEEYMKNAIIANLLGGKYRAEIENIYKQWADYSDTNKDGVYDLTPDEADALKNAYNGLTNQMIEDRDNLAELFGWDDLKSGADGLSKGVQSVTEDTANLLASYLNAVRGDVSIERSLMEKLIADDMPRINYLVEAQLTQLNAIAANTLRNANAADKIYDIINRMVDKGGNKWRI